MNDSIKEFFESDEGRWFFIHYLQDNLSIQIDWTSFKDNREITEIEINIGFNNYNICSTKEVIPIKNTYYD